MTHLLQAAHVRLSVCFRTGSVYPGGSKQVSSRARRFSVVHRSSSLAVRLRGCPPPSQPRPPSAIAVLFVFPDRPSSPTVRLHGCSSPTSARLRRRRPRPEQTAPRRRADITAVLPTARFRSRECRRAFAHVGNAALQRDGEDRWRRYKLN